jgi:glycosyltransferase involved in cell wall biosynthesis
LQVTATPEKSALDPQQPRVRCRLTAEQLAVVIPARNEAHSLRDIVANCLPQARIVIVVDDASTDGTLQTVADLPLIAIRSDTHLGKGGALSLGFRRALELGAQAIVTLDADGQHEPRDIPAFLEAANRHPGAVIIGARKPAPGRAPFARRFANRVADYWISRAAGMTIRDSQCGHRLYPRELLAAVKASTAPEDGFVFESEMLIQGAWLGFGVVALPIESRYPENLRASHFRPVRDIWRITRMVARKTFAGDRPQWTHDLDRGMD